MNSRNKFGLSDSDLNEIISALRRAPEIQSAKIFGSRAKGTYRNGSDIDIAIEAPAMDYDRFLRLCTNLDDLMLPYKIDLIVQHNIQNDALLDHIQRVGISLW